MPFRPLTFVVVAAVLGSCAAPGGSKSYEDICGDIVAPSRGGLHVKVVDEAGTPVPGKKVAIQAPPPPRPRPTGSPAGRYGLLCMPVRVPFTGTETTDSRGLARFEGFGTGTYEVKIDERDTLASPTTAQVRAGRTAEVTLTVPPSPSSSPSPSPG